MSQNRNRLRTLAAPAAVLVGLSDSAQGGGAVATPPQNPPVNWHGQNEAGIKPAEPAASVERVTKESDSQPRPGDTPRLADEKRWESSAGLTIGKPPRAPKV